MSLDYTLRSVPVCPLAAICEFRCMCITVVLESTSVVFLLLRGVRVPVDPLVGMDVSIRSAAEFSDHLLFK